MSKTIRERIELRIAKYMVDGLLDDSDAPAQTLLNELEELYTSEVKRIIGPEAEYNDSSKKTSHYNAKIKGRNQLRSEQLKRAGL